MMAALQAIPAALWDAARLDGATAWQLARHLIWPFLLPWSLLLLLRDLALSAQNSLTPVLLMTGGGPGYATTLLPFLSYEEAFTHLRLGSASALMMLLFGLLALLVGVAYALWRRWFMGAEL